MDQKKTGLFLKEVRKEKSLTQEQVAEKLGVSGRTISRWETGEYMPDISMLVEIAELYDVDVREIIDGERKNNMNSEVKEVAEKMADYSVMEKKTMLKWIKTMSMAMIIVSICNIILNVFRSFFMMRSLPSINKILVFASGFVNTGAILSYILLAFSALVLLNANGKLKNIEHSRKASIVVKAVVVVAIILALISVIQAVATTGVIYMNNSY